ncbi:phosphomannomutase [Candidatus Aquiluna sp. IMCC13023]|uniref:phospho-sugar mutase n=1 Tax=Candidatus Aquiluna sp. IMCC13023 TaxID=1081644 RepID=UPI00025B2B62|nr:phospho-sugar mutase [Candidatus Aquiluna sp. IMCC13023]EIC92054.1 phosphomannomutase [Candidatus Aquiluna sp. IMCC13023]
MSQLADQAQAWLDQDPDPVTKIELQALIDNHDEEDLASRFSTRLDFGTAGLRGELGAGPNRMNRVVVAQTALGLAEFLNTNRDTYLDPSGELSAVIGYDGRTNSDVFAMDSAEILSAAGIKTFLFSEMVPTPVAAFTGRRLGASLTVVVTASHNPPRDNGYKVYLGGPTGGSQLVPPQDREIANLITAISTKTTFQEIPKSKDFTLIGQPEINQYLDRAKTLVSLDESEIAKRSALRITHTALHGVGWKVVSPLLAAAGFRVLPVKLQAEPDPQFPTVAFPNPEEKGAMDLSFAEATSNDSDIILANDPDADRLAVAVRSGGGYQMLTGDQVGLLLANQLAPTSKAIANSIVSADLSALAKHYGVPYTQTLTGFKWISKVPDLGYGYEEALGYCVDPEYTPDKDGITAALVIAQMASDLKAQGKSLVDQIQDLAEKFGHVATGQVSLRVSDLSVIGKITSDLRANPPASIGDEAVLFEDYLARTDAMKTDALILSSNSIKIIVRPSGTEPKLKCYLQASATSKTAAAKLLEDLKTWADATLSALK